ncbi:tetratricopeptide repeat protein [Flavobacterium piscinae]|uniref:tetratricopeptide repeat protein n=1 Tax=Flavobacterium piscinae TaxID=2506424 RepID=UPI001990E478|nr:tetratricopeptide repeat protein [Flavobacterium piscinae]MBC8883957.1 tetratricopeptide repeat protein [Flavobacterium piscinae]
MDAILQKEETGAELTKKEASVKNANQINLDAFQTIRTSMDNKIAQLATCERLIPFLGGSFEEKKGDAEWLRRAADRLDKKGCSSDPLFSKISETLHQLNPTAKSAYNLGVSYYNKKNTAKALEYFNQSAELHKDSGEKAKVYYTVARNIYGSSNKSQARAFAEKALAKQNLHLEKLMFLLHNFMLTVQMNVEMIHLKKSHLLVSDFNSQKSRNICR